jgi:integrase
MPLIVSNKSPMKGDCKVQDIKASILDRSSRKFWYIRCQVFFENENVQTFEESTKILKIEKTLKYMQTRYLPAWLARKQNEISLQKFESKKFSYFYEKYLEDHKGDKSFHNRIYIYRKVQDFFGKFEVTKITRLAVKEYLASLNITSRTKKDYLSCIKGILDIAMDAAVINQNVAVGIMLKASEKESIYPFSADEVMLLLEKSDEMLKNYLGIALHTGMRSGEILGLMHQDILNDRITIKRSISKGRITTPKTVGSIRDIPMFEAIKPFIDNQKKLSQSLYLFDYNKEFIRDVSFFKRRWQQLIKDCRIEYRKLYSTRHTFITAMLNSEKFKIMEIAAIVGHTSPEMIMKNYAGFIKDSHLKVDTSIDLFKNNSDSLGDSLKARI